MTTLIDPNRQCACVICDPTTVPDHGRDAHCPDNTADQVMRFGWSSVGIATADGVPAWAFTVGLWHTLGSPEVAMFGLNNPDMQHWVNAIADQIKAGRPLMSGDDKRTGILPGHYPVVIRPVHSSWYLSLFGTALRFYNGRPPLPITQAIWPDRHGFFPWDDQAGDNCKANQPHLWLPKEEHPSSLWTELDAITPWPFRDSEVRTSAFTTGRILEHGAPIIGVVRGQRRRLAISRR